MTESAEVIAIRECDCCGDRKADAAPDGCGAFVCRECREDLDAEARYEETQ